MPMPIPILTLPATFFCLAAFQIGISAASAEEIAKTDQHALNTLARTDPGAAFLDAFDAGDELTEFSFAAEHGVGANIGEGRRFTRFPRADLTGPTEWANHMPMREGGANATSCIACHNAPFANGAGDVALNAVVDPAHTGDPTQYLERNTLPLFALGIPQRLAEEISADLSAQRDQMTDAACRSGSATADLKSKTVDYGALAATRTQMTPCVLVIDTSGLDGVDDDLTIKPFGWKGNHATIRAFTRGAAHNELGLQAVEIIGDQDGDFDGVTHELTVGDISALVIYMAGLERPVSTLELSDAGLLELEDGQRTQILRGEGLFETIGCAACHIPAMALDDPTFREPSQTPGFFDVAFPDGSDPAAHGLLQDAAITFDLTRDPPNNRIALADGSTRHLGALEVIGGTATARWFTDFKRHDMGPGLSDPSDPLGLGASVFLTRSLAGVGSTGPWLHDGRATTLSDAILAHGGAAAASRTGYAALPDVDRDAIVAFLESLVIYVQEDH